MIKFVIENNNTISLTTTSVLQKSPSLSFTDELGVVQYCVLSTDKKEVSKYPCVSFIKDNISYYPTEEYLPISSGVLVYSSSDINDILTSYSPPTFLEVFNTWGRIAYYNSEEVYYPSGTTPLGEAAAWEISDGIVRNTTNSARVTGFVSEDSFSDYIHEVTLSSTASDDDYIGVIIGFKRDGTSNKMLMLSINAMTAQTYHFELNSHTAMSVWNNGTRFATSENPISTSGWLNMSPCRVKVERVGTKITAWCSDFNSTELVHTLSMDTSNYEELDWFTGDLPYGYFAQSQQYSTFSDIEFVSTSNNNSVVYNCDNGDVWRYSDGKWNLDTTVKLWDVIGYPRYITSTEGITYKVLNGSIEKV